MFDHLRSHVDAAQARTADPAEHEAFLDLLVLAMYADRSVSQAELEALDTYEAAHDVEQHFVESVAKVRRALAAGTTDALLADIAARITSAELKAQALEACDEIVRADGTTADAEVDFLARARTALA